MAEDQHSDQTNREREYLTTVGRGRLNIEEVLSQFASRAVVLIVIGIEPIGTRTGRLEERGAWIHRLWETVRAQHPDLHGCRLMWTQVFFMADTADIDKVQDDFRQMLPSLVMDDFENRCLLATASGTATEREKVLDDMQHDLQALDYQGYVRFPHRLCNGMDWPC